MKRRTFIAGVGALSAGGAAALGTGAFSSAEATRDVSVQVADDASAYLALESTSQYADGSGDAISLDFGTMVEDADGNDLGGHVGEDSTTVFGSGAADRNVFIARNQGTKDVELTPGQQVKYFDSGGSEVSASSDDIELLINIVIGSAAATPTLSPGDEAGYFVQVSAGDNPPSQVETTFEINANEV